MFIEKSVVLFIIVCVINQITDASRCNRTPEGPGALKTAADGRYHLKILDNVDKYSPGATYTIAIEGVETGRRIPSIYHKFSGFFIIVSKKDEPVQAQETSNPIYGFFSLLFGNTVAKLICSNIVTHTTTTPKSAIQVLWTAPAPGTGCVVLRATVIEHRDIWYMDDGPLSKEMCEVESSIDDMETAVNEECCACPEAKYELTFEGLWSRNTHPKDFPSNGWLTSFSDLIGASHNVDYRFWLNGGKASEGVREVAQSGVTRVLESELKSNSENLRTIIKARGLSYPNVTGKTFAVFRVDRQRHLISFITMFGPSPDWFVGVSGLDLCLTNCTWIESKIIDLYPWDAGTDSGPTYMSPDQPTIPADSIRKIRPDFPNDPRSPFYDPLIVRMKPIARLYLQRQRLYEKSCPADDEDNENDNDNEYCQTTRWSGWSRCDANCGRGNRYKNREYVNEYQAIRMGCTKELRKQEECYDQSDNCDGNGEEDEDTDSTEPQCALTEWNDWSECEPKCGRGKQYQERFYVNKRAKKRCEGPGHYPLLKRIRDCVSTYEDCAGDITTEVDANVEPTEQPECEYSEWRKGQCSVTCGEGVRINRRVVISGGTDCQETEEEITCKRKKCVVPSFCYEEPDSGTCRNATNKWFYDGDLQACRLFTWTCGDHGNKFDSQDECMAICTGSRPLEEDNTSL